MKASFNYTKHVFCVLAFLFLSNCSKNDDNISYDLIGNWKVIYFIENGSKIFKSNENTWPDINNGDITANFTRPDDNGNGEVSGIKVTNRYSGSYTINENGKIEIGAIVTTFINEPDWTELFQITRVEDYEIRNSKLIIYYNNKNNSIVFERNLNSQL